MLSRSALRSGAIAVGLGLLGLVSTSPAAEGPSWRIDGGDVAVVVPLKPGGAFEAKTSSLSGELTAGAERPLALDGEISVDLATVDTGIGLRNRHLGERLELSRGEGFAKAVLSEIVLKDAGGAAFRGKTAFEGTLLLHGVKRPVTGQGEILDGGAGLRVQAEFVLTLTDFGIEPPQYMGVGVTNKLVVKVAFTASPTGRLR